MSPKNKAGRPEKEPPIGSLGARVRAARKRAGYLDREKIGRLVGLKGGMISRGELQSNFSESALFLLAQEYKDNFGDTYFKAYLDEWLPRMVKLWEPEIRALMAARVSAMEMPIIDAGTPLDEEEKRQGSG